MQGLSDSVLLLQNSSCFPRESGKVNAVGVLD
jgi:hypothetical protein